MGLLLGEWKREELVQGFNDLSGTGSELRKDTFCIGSRRKNIFGGDRDRGVQVDRLFNISETVAVWHVTGDNMIRHYRIVRLECFPVEGSGAGAVQQVFD